MDNNLLAKIGLSVGAIIVGFSSAYILRKQPDNWLEESAEEVLKKNSGIDIDFTPDSPEKENDAKK